MPLLLAAVGRGWARIAALGGAAGAFVLAALGAYATVKRDGARAEALREAKERERELEKASRAQADVVRLDDADVMRELRGRYTRRP